MRKLLTTLALLLAVNSAWLSSHNSSSSGVACAAIPQDSGDAKPTPAAGGNDRILDEADDARIADEAEDLELISEFAALEPKVAVDWQPHLGMPKLTLENGLLVPVTIGDGNEVFALWPVSSVCTEEYARTQYVVRTEERTREVAVTKCRAETRSQTVNVTIYVPETKIKTVEVPFTDEQGNARTRTEEKAYQVQVPVTEQREQTYTVMVPYSEVVTQTYEVKIPTPTTETYTRTFNCFTADVKQVDASKVPLFRGDRRPALWSDFIREVPKGEVRNVVFFDSMTTWSAEWDSLLSADAFVVVMESVQPKPVVANPQAVAKLAKQRMLPLPVRAMRSQQPELQYAFSPFIEITTARPMELPIRPVPASEWLTSELSGDSKASTWEDSTWAFQIVHDVANWNRTDQQYASLIHVEQVLSSGGQFLISENDANLSDWTGVFQDQVPVYRSAGWGRTELPSDSQLRRECEASILAREAIQRGDAVTALQWLSEISIPELLDATMLCKVAYGLHFQGMEDSAMTLVGIALELTPDPIERTRLIRQQGNSRVWLESAVLEFPLLQAKAIRTNEVNLDRLSEIQSQVMRPRTDAPEPGIEPEHAAPAPFAPAPFAPAPQPVEAPLAPVSPASESP